MPIEDLLDECVRIRAAGGDITPLLAQYPELREEVETLLNLAQTTERLPRAELSPEMRARMFKRITTATRPPPDEVHTRTDSSGPEEARLRQLAYRLGVPRDAVRRYLGPNGAAQIGEFLGLPGYGGMFAALGLLLRWLQVLEHRGLGL